MLFFILEMLCKMYLNVTSKVYALHDVPIINKALTRFNPVLHFIKKPVI